MGTLAELLALEQEDAIGETLEKYADSTDFSVFLLWMWKAMG